MRTAGGACWAWASSTPRATARGSRSLRGIRDRGVGGVRLAVSDAHAGLASAIGEAFQGAAWQRCCVHLMRNCIRAAGSRRAARRVARTVAPVFRLRDAGAVREAYHIAADMLQGFCPAAPAVLEEAMAELYDGAGGGASELAPRQPDELRAAARKAIEASLELADSMEAA